MEYAHCKLLNLILITDSCTILGRNRYIRDNITISECHRELGMLDNVIKDFQLSASSWQHDYPPTMARQYLAGWCADTTDVNPYLQVSI